MSEEAFIYEAIRTPRGKQRNGSLNEVKPLNLVVGLVDELRRRYPDLDETLISDMILGVVSPVGDQGGDIARTAVLAAGLPETTGGVQLNRFCASGLEAVNTAAQKVRSGWDDLVLAGGVESMSRVPMGSDGGAWATDPETNYQIGFVPQGIGADLIATIEGFSREDVDRYALRVAGEGRRGVVGRLLRQVRRAGARPERLGHPRPRRAHAPRHHARGPGQAEDRVRRHRRDGRLRRRGAAEVPLGREDRPRPHRRQQLRHRRRRRAGARRQRESGHVAGPDAASPHRGHRHQRRGPGHHAHRPDAGHPQGARPRGPDGRRHRPVRAERGLRVGRAEVPEGPRTSPTRSSTSTVAPSRWVTRWAPPAP